MCRTEGPTLAPASHNKPLIEPQSFVAEVEAIHIPNFPATDSKHCWNEPDETDDELIELRTVKIQADINLGKMLCYHHYTTSTDTSKLCLRTFSQATETNSQRRIYGAKKVKSEKESRPRTRVLTSKGCGDAGALKASKMRYHTGLQQHVWTFEDKDREMGER